VPEKIINRNFDVLGIGSSIVDILVNCEDDFLESLNAHKGTMHLVDEVKILNLTMSIKNSESVSGGSVANTMVGLASFGADPAFIGKTNNDDLGHFFSDNIKSQGVFYETIPLDKGLPTARCIVLVTPDAERTMFTYLGASSALSSQDMSEDLICSSKVLYIEGYQWDILNAREGIIRASQIARTNGTKISLSLSDPFVVDRHRVSLLSFIEEFVDILFANEAEIMSLYFTKSLDSAIPKLQSNVDLASITFGEKGSYTIDKNSCLFTPAIIVEHPIDTTGAGDMYAAGFLYGYVNQKKNKTCAQLGNLAASEIIKHIGARPLKPLSLLSNNFVI